MNSIGRPTNAHTKILNKNLSFLLKCVYWWQCFLPALTQCLWWWWTFFVEWLTNKKHGVLFSARVIGGGLHQCKSLEKPQAGFESAQNLSSSFVEWSCVVVITKPQHWHCIDIIGIVQNISSVCIQAKLWKHISFKVFCLDALDGS